MDGRFPNTIIGDPENQLPMVGLVHDTQFSQELRWASPADQRLTWVAGAFALHSDKREGGPIGFFFDPNTVAGLFSAANNYTQVSDQKVATDSFALFGEATFDITHELKLTLGRAGDGRAQGGHLGDHLQPRRSEPIPRVRNLFAHLERLHAQGYAFMAAEHASDDLCQRERRLQERRL